MLCLCLDLNLNLDSKIRFWVRFWFRDRFVLEFGILDLKLGLYSWVEVGFGLGIGF